MGGRFVIIWNKSACTLFSRASCKTFLILHQHQSTSKYLPFAGRNHMGNTENVKTGEHKHKNMSRLNRFFTNLHNKDNIKLFFSVFSVMAEKRRKKKHLQLPRSVCLVAEEWSIL